MTRTRRRRPLLGLFTRFVSFSISTAIVSALVVATPLSAVIRPSPPASTSTLTPVTVPGAASTAKITWPAGISAAVVIPSLGVQETWHDHVAPIASLTKLMTAYVTLQRLPLSLGQSGPCVTINRADVLYYDSMVASDESSAAVAVGERLCESTLLDGLLVHSAGNFATILANMSWGGSKAFVAQMNLQARALGLTHTHYADTSGVDPRSVSTALEQGRLAALLMQSPLVRRIVDQSSVTLPVAGTLGSYTPFVGVDQVVGVKSGRTDAAGGCDVMAMRFELNGQTQLSYAVVLGARGGDLLGPAGEDALSIEQSILATKTALHVTRGMVVGTLGWGTKRTDVVVKAPLNLEWFSALHDADVRVTIWPEFHAVEPGDVVGWLSVGAGIPQRTPLTVAHPVAPAAVAQRLR